MTNRIILNGTSYFGYNARRSLLDEIKGRGFENALVVTDKSLLDAKVTSKVTTLLEEISLPYEVYSDIKPNPNVANVNEGLEILRNSKADFLIAVGGGSVIDTAKCMSIIMTNPEFSDVISLDGVASTKNPGMPLIALPTTAGTAAEVTINYVITDDERKKKMVCVDPHDIPVVAIIDPELMATMPKSLAAATGMDALTHAMEGYITKSAWLMTDMFHKQAMNLIFNNLEKAVNEKDKDAIEAVGYGQYIAGMGFSNVGLGIVHSMAHSLGAYFDTPHGLANALLLPHILRWNGKVCPDRFRDMGREFGLDMDNLTDEEAVNKVADAVDSLARAVGIPKTLKEIGIPYDALETLADQAINDVCTGGNPREVTKEDILALYKEAYE